MPNRDTYDILEAERLDIEDGYRQGTNIQPATLVKAMVSSEPCLFSNQSEVAIKPMVVDAMFYYRIAKLREIALWHARLQVDFYMELEKEPKEDVKK